jgi:hypothetical protein
MWFFNEKTLHLIWLGGGLSSLMASWFGLKSTRGNLNVSNKTHQSKTQSKTRGSEPAREGGGTFNINVPDTPLSRASSAPTGDLWLWRILCMAEKLVGVSLLAMAAARSISLWLTHRFREQAHSYRGFVVCGGFCIWPRNLWERACSRRSQHIQHHLT